MQASDVQPSHYFREASISARSTSASSGGVVCSRISSLIAPPLTLEQVAIRSDTRQCVAAWAARRAAEALTTTC